MKRRHILKMGALAAASAAFARARIGANTAAAGAAEHHHDAAARLRSRRAADDLLHRSRHRGRRSRVRQPRAGATRRSSGCGPARLWSEGPAWSGQGRYLVWSDIPNNRQLRWIEDDERVSVFRQPSNNSNGNTFDFQGRQISCEHLTRRVVRYEHDGSITILCDRFGGKRFNSPNDVAAHPDGSYWFTDPPYGGQLYEGQVDEAGRADQSRSADSIRASASRPKPGGCKRELPNGVYRVDAQGSGDARRHRRAGARSQRPDVLARLQDAVCGEHRARPGRHAARAARASCSPSTSPPTTRVSNQKLFTDFMIDGVKARADGVRCDVLRQCLVLEQRRPRRGLQRRHGVDARREAAGPHSLARSVRQPLLRRPEAESPVHGGEPVALRGVREHAGRRPGRQVRPTSFESGRWSDTTRRCSGSGHRACSARVAAMQSAAERARQARSHHLAAVGGAAVGPRVSARQRPPGRDGLRHGQSRADSAQRRDAVDGRPRETRQSRGAGRAAGGPPAAVRGPAARSLRARRAQADGQAVAARVVPEPRRPAADLRSRRRRSPTTGASWISTPRSRASPIASTAFATRARSSPAIPTRSSSSG